ncbi:MAG TPA: zinc ribbon domain-containing protein [Actinomycetes bacterium]|nr:zinc ribbon domain-containing protein [Actinomycetes bacterium]
MPRYDYRCRACGATFEITRPMAEVDAPTPCPQGHDDTVRLLPAIAITGRAGSPLSTGSPAPAGGAGGGCCGGACGCGG